MRLSPGRSYLIVIACVSLGLIMYELKHGGFAPTPQPPPKTQWVIRVWGGLDVPVLLVKCKREPTATYDRWTITTDDGKTIYATGTVTVSEEAAE